MQTSGANAVVAEADLNLLRRFCDEGDETAFTQIVRRHADMVYGTALRMLRDRPRAEEVSQETFFRLIRQPRAVTHSLAGWLHRTATQLAIDVIRSDAARRQREMNHQVAHTDEPAQAATWAELSPRLDEAINELPEDARAILIEHFLHGRSQRDIAATLGESPATVCRKIKASLDQLRTSLKRRGVVIAAASLATLLPASTASAAPATLMAELGKMAMISTAATSLPAVNIIITTSGWMKIAAVVFFTLAIAAIMMLTVQAPQATRDEPGQSAPAAHAPPMIFVSQPQSNAHDLFSSTSIAGFRLADEKAQTYIVVYKDGHTVIRPRAELDSALRVQTGHSIAEVVKIAAMAKEGLE